MMKTILNAFVLVLCALVMSACMVMGDVRGEVQAQAASKRKAELVAVLIVSGAEMRLNTLLPALRSLPHNVEAAQRASARGAAILNATAPELESSLRSAGLPHRVVTTVSSVSAADLANATHAVFVTPSSVSTSDNVTKASVNIDVVDLQSQAVIWKGESALTSGTAGVVRGAVEQRRQFAAGVVRAVESVVVK